jgi:hypothetical protein
MKFIIPCTFLVLLTAFLTAVGWLIKSPDFEPAVTSLALLATIIGLFAERWLTEMERRKSLLHALAHEVYININILWSEPFLPVEHPPKALTVYPRLFVSVLQTVISSGAFAKESDKELFKLLHDWQQRASEFNQRLEVTELRTFANPTSEELSAFQRALLDGNVLPVTKASIKQLAELLFASYAKESGITKDSVLF